MKSCCCNGGGLRWLAQLCCNTSCVGTCPTEEESQSCECFEGITFCDEYRIAQGMPAIMNPGLCYWWFHNGCRYRVLGTDNSPCVPFQGTPHNEGTYAGATERLPNDADCSETCGTLCQSGLSFAKNVPWVPGCDCGSAKTVNFDANGAKCCGCECLPLAEACSGDCPNATMVLNLTTWPLGYRPVPTTCTEVVNSCENCNSTGSIPNTITYVNYNHLVGSNYCDDNCPGVDPCDGSGECNNGGVGIACSANASVTISLQGNPSNQYEFGFSVTRSCPEATCDQPPEWIAGGPVAGDAAVPSLGICDCAGEGPCRCCSFVGLLYPGTNAEELARVINETLGSNSDNCVTYTAEGKREAWLENSYACLADKDGTFPSTNSCHDCVFSPSTWIGPFFSDCNKKATWLYKPTYVYQIDCSYGCANYTSYNVNNNRCMCTGSNQGAVSGSWSSGPGGEFKYGAGTCPDFAPLQPLDGSAPCMAIPTVS